ncbi:Ger(x)C family spore germination protein [Ferdinandcohnia sp. SAFN-114]|uniref:Ger(x)C family spore germination protein n=1 Tax=Ferdinandcohnia sp. SAFN-114 TaxID=3387275 RepID=UPI003F7E0FBD
MKKICKILLIMMLLTGCSNYRELNELGLIVAMGIDPAKNMENGYRVTFQVINPSQLSPTGSTSGLPITNYTVESNTLVDAYRIASNIIPRENDVSHLSLVVISESLARKGLKLLLDPFVRGKQTRTTFPVFIARGDSAENILGVVEPLESNPTKSIKSTSENNQTMYGLAKITPIHEAISSISSEGKELLLTGIQLNKELTSSNQTDNLNNIKPALIEVSGLAIFKKDKLVGWYDGELARTAHLILSEVESSSFLVPCGEGDHITFTAKRSNSKINTVLKPTPTLRVDVGLTNEISETSCYLDFSNAQVLDRVEKDLEKKIKEEIENTIKISQDQGTDVFGFGNKLNKENPNYWKKHKKEWDSIYSDAKIEVHVNATLIDSGLSSKPYQIR